MISFIPESDKGIGMDARRPYPRSDHIGCLYARDERKSIHTTSEKQFHVFVYTYYRIVQYGK